jgi:hypothetical protein
MPITGFNWGTNQGYDVHILRNNELSKRLDEQIFVTEEIANLVDPDGNNKIELKSARDLISRNVPVPQEFGGVFFIPSWEQQATKNNPIFEFNGISVNVVTGQITARPQAAPRITSFVLTAVLQIQSGGGNPTPFTATPRIMVHVHDQITQAWITPSSLTARPDVVRGVSNLELKLVSSKPVEKIVWGSDDTFSRNIDQFLLNAINPFNIQNFPSGQTFFLPAQALFDNRRHFPNNQIFKDPIQLEIKYLNQADPVRMTIPTHLSHLLKTGQTLNDGAGNDLFEVVRVEKPTQYRASVYVTFDDGTMGDITNNHGLTWDRGAGVNANDIAFDSEGAFEVSTTAVGKTLAIKAILPPSLARPGLNDVLGQVVVRDSWLNANPIAQPLAGSPLQLPTDQVPNVLFIAEGFDNRADFERMALSVYGKLRNETKTAPWDQLFTNSMKAWMIFERSEQTGASIQYESVTFEDATLENGSQADVALPLFDLIKQGASLIAPEGGLTVEGLVLRVGFPLPADAGASKNAKLGEWRQLYGPAFGTGDTAFSDDVFNFWSRRLAARRLLEERDTLWGLRCGEKPKLEPLIQSNIIYFNDQSRLQRANMDLFLSKIRANTATGEAIGEKCWSRDERGRFGKDYGLVIFLVGGLRSIGARFSETFFPAGNVNTGIGVGLVDDHLPLNFLGDRFNLNFPFFRWEHPSGAPQFQIVPFNVPEQIPIAAFSIVAHELCHSFNLDDEYARVGKLNIPDRTRVNSIYNLQLHNDLLDGSQLSGEKIKWRWPRMRKAGVLESVQAAGSEITVGLSAGHTSQFNVGEEVRMRQRDILATPLDSLSSPELKVKSKNETGNTLVLEPLSSTPFTWTVFGRGSLLFTPVKAPAEERNNPTGDKYAEVLSPLMRRQINQSHKPQTKNFPCTQEDTNDQQDPVNLPSDLDRPDNHRNIIGLFSGGKEFSCGIYHPSGECIMRKTVKEIRERVPGLGLTRFREREVFKLCHVCRYSLVDQIDPRRHDSIDKAYDEIYPSKESPTKAILIKIAIALVIAAALGFGIYKYFKKDDE